MSCNTLTGVLICYICFVLNPWTSPAATIAAGHAEGLSTRQMQQTRAIIARINMHWCDRTSECYLGSHAAAACCFCLLLVLLLQVACWGVGCCSWQSVLVEAECDCGHHQLCGAQGQRTRHCQQPKNRIHTGTSRIRLLGRNATKTFVRHKQSQPQLWLRYRQIVVMH